MAEISHHDQPLYSKTVTVLSNEPFCAGTKKITLSAPGFPPLTKPGQFAMLRLPNRTDPLLGRPFAVYSVDTATDKVSLIYLIVGKMTARLAEVKAGETLELTGPLGNGWSVIEGNTSRSGILPFDHLIMTAGGVGQTPFYMLCWKYALYANRPKMTLLYGARNRDRLAPLSDFEPLGVTIRTATEDGSAGYKGYVTDLIPRAIAESGIEPGRTVIAACGPKPMLRAVYLSAKERGVPCWTSLESPMSCGLGICFGCVIEYRADNGEWDYRRTCKDGPVFDAYRLRWDV